MKKPSKKKLIFDIDDYDFIEPEPGDSIVNFLERDKKHSKAFWNEDYDCFTILNKYGESKQLKNDKDYEEKLAKYSIWLNSEAGKAEKEKEIAELEKKLSKLKENV